ncbi:hypothetical protein JD844_000041 [Phrynosoma platyrhinos]|uniref:C2H2-type domain-containing protein n=1 Tax=Phrynosoma platyrhinos TaxID=52577 RepID=A0ABQ7SQ44_PHRPL|nr:hypothetical protein JD844_000041 [Phrynosoma platyrhinos]
MAHLSNPQEHQCLQGGHDRSFQCTQCLKIFHQATDLLEHQCLQVEQKPFVCGVCKMGFSLLTSLAQHHNVHNGSAAVKCSICEKTYKAAATHPCTPSGERPFRCGACHKAFRRPSDLRQHERTHSTERPFQCDLCQMSFKQQYALMRHRRTHKTVVAVGGVAGPAATVATATPATPSGEPELQSGPFKCSLCEKGFIQPAHLLYHQHVHGIENLFKCNACQKGFSQSSELLRHRCVQSAERPFNRAFVESAPRAAPDGQLLGLSYSKPSMMESLASLTSRVFKMSSKLLVWMRRE